MWLFDHFKTKTAKAALSCRMSTTENSTAQREGPFTTYCRAVNYLLENYRTEDVIAEAKGGFIIYKQPKHISTIRYSETFREEALRYGGFYKE